MSSGTGENEQGLMKILDFTRLAAIAILLLHFYYYCYKAFEGWQLTATITSRLLQNIYNTGLFSSFNLSKLIALGLLVISLIGATGRKDEKLNGKTVTILLLTGLCLFFLSNALFWINASVKKVAIAYMAVSSLGFLLVLSSGTMLSRLIKVHLSKIFSMK
jgi:YWFCY protein